MNEELENVMSKYFFIQRVQTQKMAKFEKYPKRIVIYTHEIELEKVISKHLLLKECRHKK